MTREHKARILASIVLAVAIGVPVGRRLGRPPRPPAEPQDAVYAMLDAARAGDVKAYLACYTGTMESALRQTVSESTTLAFAKYLKDSNSAIKGVAISDPQTTGDSEVKLRVEYVYQDRNEVQMIYVEKRPNGWKIARADSEERIKTLIPYGTPVQ
jgi:hypothetical protein